MHFLTCVKQNHFGKHYISTCIGMIWLSVPITDTMKISIWVADTSADLIIGTPLDFADALMFITSFDILP